MATVSVSYLCVMDCARGTRSARARRKRFFGGRARRAKAPPDSLHTLSPRVPWRRPRVRRFRPSRLVTVSVPPRLDLQSQSRPPGRAFARPGRPGRTGGSAEHLWLGAGGGASKKKLRNLAISRYPAPALGEGRERASPRNRCCVGMRAPREKPFKPGHPHPPKQLRPQFQPVP